MLTDWNLLSDELQLMVTREALRLLAAVVRVTGNEALTAVGHA
jgi:hypothetical protein